MPPKAKSASGESTIYAVTHEKGIVSLYASKETATERADSAKEEGLNDVKIETCTLIGGSIVVDKAPAKAKPAAKSTTEAKATAKTKSKTKSPEDEDEEEAEPAPKANTAAKKTKTAAEQREANKSKTGKGKSGDEDLPENVKALLQGKGTVLAGKVVVVTGIPPILGRKNADTLVSAYGGKLVRSLSKNTNLVVLGNDAGPKKLEQIEELGVKTVDDAEFIAMLEKGDGAAAGHTMDADEDEDDEEEEEKPKPKKRARKQK